MVKVPFKTIKIKDETYESINVFIGEMRKELKRPVSVDEAIKRLLNFKMRCVEKMGIVVDSDILIDLLRKIRIYHLPEVS